MLEGWALGAYRAAMTMAAGLAGLRTRLPDGGPGRGLEARLGRLAPGERATASAAPAIWIHAASVGELLAVRPLIGQLRERFPERLYVVSTLTETGLALARTLPEVHLAFLFPLDAPHVVRPLIAQFRLEAFLFTETEIWPTFLVELEAAGVPAIMVSGRVSARTAGRAAWLRPVYRRALAQVLCCMQSQEDAERIVALGADRRRVQVAGSLKFDAPSVEPPAEVQRLGAALAAAGRRLLVAGSTHEGEDAPILHAYAALAVEQPELALLLAPRHPERVDAVAALVEQEGLAMVRFTTLVRGGGAALPAGPVVVLLDVVGPLAHCYALGDVAFVGGTLVPVGGHNLLEPARAGRPVVFGPHTANVAELAERLIAIGGGVRVPDAAALAGVLGPLLAQPARATEMGRRAQALVADGQGALARHVKTIAARLSSAGFSRAVG